MMSFRRRVPFEFSFVLLVTVSGLLLLLLSTSLTMTSRVELLRKSPHVGISYPLNPEQALWAREALPGNTGRETNRTRETDSVSSSAQDPLWMKREINPVTRFVPGTGTPHPFLRPNVLDNSDVCRGERVDLLLVIHSHVKNAQRRRILRENWAATGVLAGLSVRRIFVLGRAKRGKSAQVRVNSEQVAYGDLVQGHFRDSAANLTLKAAMALRWINDHCLHARFVLKADDDMFVNVFSLVETYLQRLDGRQRTVMCHVNEESEFPVEGSSRAARFVPSALFPSRTRFPRFCSGYVVAMTTDAIPWLYEASYRAPYLAFEDMYVYGLLPYTAGGPLEFLDLSGDLTLAAARLVSRYESREGTELLGGSAGDDRALVRLWQAALARLGPWARRRMKYQRAAV